MSGIRVKYDTEFKKNAVKLSYASPKSVKQVAQDLGLHEIGYTLGVRSTPQVATKHVMPRLRKKSRFCAYSLLNPV